MVSGVRETVVTYEDAIEFSNRLLARLIRFHPEMTPPDLKQKILDEIKRQEDKKKKQPKRTKVAQPNMTRREWMQFWYDQITAKARPLRWQSPGEKILREVARKYRYDVAQLKGHSRNTYVVKARQEAIYRIRAETELSLPQIGKIMGGRDHTTAMHSIKKHAERFNLPIPGVKR